MTDFAQWEAANEAYLAAALEWLRLRLSRFAAAAHPAPAPSAAVIETPVTPAPEAPAPAPPPSSQQKGSWWALRRNESKTLPPGTPPPPPRALPPLPPSGSDAQLQIAEEAMRRAESADPPPALTLLMRRFGMTPFERDVLLLCAAMELDTSIAGRCAQAQDDPSRPYPTFALAMALFDDPAWESTAPDRPLRFWRLIEIGQMAAQPLNASPLRIDERIMNFIKGLGDLDDRVMPFVTRFDAAPQSSPFPASQQRLVDEVLATVRQRGGGAIWLTGSDRESKRMIASAAAQSLGITMYRIAGELLPQQMADIETLARLWQREAVLGPVALYIDAQDAEAQNATVRRLSNKIESLHFIDAREAPERNGHGAVIEIVKPDAAEQRALWEQVLGDQKAADALAGQFNLGIEAITRVATAARASGEAGREGERAWQLATTETQPRLHSLVRRVDARATWDLLVLPDPELKMLRELAAQVRARSQVYNDWGFRDRMNRGLGISALFAGVSGAGKTMAAEVLATELDLPLHVIDLAMVVSKYIGETEKNIREIFDAAEDGGGILFFDEADALFGKRSEVKDSHDRYANIEIGYLLQRMEAYRGLAILATNMKSALDPAFMRRIRFIINFAFPDATSRLRIWEKVFPSKTPTEDLDLKRLARLDLTGGSILNVALNSAFAASTRGTPVTMAIVLDAARAELRKLEKPINEADFRLAEEKPRKISIA